ncbi:MAG TPA: AraC family transcriptional regulator, partial [Candidatus Methylomirabilis sp.]
LDDRSVTWVAVPAYAQQVGLNERQLRRDFRAAYGVTPRRYGVWVCLRQAAQLLRATRLRVGQIARQTGFASPTALGRAFRHGYGTLPRAFRAAPFPDPPPPGDPGPGLDRPTAAG